MQSSAGRNIVICKQIYNNNDIINNIFEYGIMILDETLLFVTSSAHIVYIHNTNLV